MAKHKRFKKYEALGETLSPIDLLSRSGDDPFFLIASPQEGGAPRPVKFYALSWSGKWVREDRGHGHGSNFRQWSFSGQARIAIGGTVNKIT
jgi:hypothetical protein